MQLRTPNLTPADNKVTLVKSGLCVDSFRFGAHEPEATALGMQDWLQVSEDGESSWLGFM